MTRDSKDKLGVGLVVGYIVGAVLVFSSLPFLIAAVVDSMFMLLLLGAFAVIYRRELREHLDSQFPTRRRG